MEPASAKVREDDYLRRGWWREDTLWSCFARNAGAEPARVALSDPPNRAAIAGGEPRSLDYRTLRSEVEATATWLGRCGIGRGDVVVAQLPNVVESIVLLLAAARLGCILSPVSTQFRAHELRQVVARARPKLALTMATIDGFDHARLWRDLAANSPALRVVTLGECDLDAGTGAGALPDPPPDAATPLTLCWTSGTEGAIKGVVRDHRRWLCLDDAVTDIAGLPAGATLLNPFPVANMAAYVGFVLPWIATGGTLAMHHPYDLRVFAMQLAAGNVDFTATPPALLNLILRREDVARQLDLRSLRAIGSGGGPLDPATMRGFKERYGIDILNLFGSTEGGALISGPGDVPDPEMRATWFPRWGGPGMTWRSRLSERVATRLVDVTTGADISQPGRPGELRFCGPGVFAGYFEDLEATANAFDECGFYRSGDLFEITGDGDRYYRFVGRLKSLVVRGGTNIVPEEIEALLTEHPGVAEVAVVGYPDDVMGEKVAAVVVPKAEASVTLDDLRTFLIGTRNVAGYKAPEKLVVVAQLPRNAMGKVLRDKVKGLAGG